MLAQKIYQDLDPSARAEAMQQTALRREEINYTHRYTDEELAAKQGKLTEVVIELIDMEEEKADFNTAFNAHKKDKEGVRNTLVKQIRDKEEDRFEDCWKYPDWENRKIGYYDRFGELVKERDMTPAEMNRNIDFGAVQPQTPQAPAIGEGEEKTPALPSREKDDADVEDIDYSEE